MHSLILTLLLALLIHGTASAQTTEETPERSSADRPVLHVLDRSGRPDTLRAREVRSPFSWFPLPVIVFDGPGHAELPEIYDRLAGPEEASAYVDTVILYRESTLWKQYDILNILGYRMRRAPETSVALSGVYTTDEGESAQVAYERGHSVREYLRSVWGIDTTRLPIAKVEQYVPSLDDERRAEEMYRVDFITDDHELFERIDLMIGGYVVDLESYDIRVETNASRSVRSVTLAVLDEAGEEIDSLVREHVPDRGNARWSHATDDFELAAPLPSTGFTIEARVRVWGDQPITRSSPLPIVRDTAGVTLREREDTDLGFGDLIRLPGFEPGDSILSPTQKFWIRSAIRRLGESQGVDPDSGLLIGTFPSIALPEAEAGQEWFEVSSFSQEHTALVEIGRSRDRAVISYIRDTLGIPLLNREWPEGVITPGATDLEEFHSGHLGSPLLLKPRYLPFPEDRLSYRSVLLGLMTPADMQAAITAARKLFEEFRDDLFPEDSGEEIMELEMGPAGE